MATRAARQERINLRASATQAEAIRQAAEATDRTVTDFILASAVQQVEQVQEGSMSKLCSPLIAKTDHEFQTVKGFITAIHFGMQCKHRDPKTGKSVDTTRGTIHYSANGAHVVPAAPNPRRGHQS